MSGRNLQTTQAASMISVSVTVPSSTGSAVTAWSLVSSALAALTPTFTDPDRVVGFSIRGVSAAAANFGAILYGGENVTGAGGTGANSYIAAGADRDMPLQDLQNCYVIAPSTVSGVTRVIEVYFNKTA